MKIFQDEIFLSFPEVDLTKVRSLQGTPVVPPEIES